MTGICEVGGDCLGPIDRHHDDYNKPDETRCLCRRHHKLWHRENGHAPGWDPSRTSVPSKTGRQVVITVPAELAGAIRARAAEDQRTVSSWLRIVVEDALREEAMT